MNLRETLKFVAQGERDVIMSRAFAAPKDMVVDAWTKPELVSRWLGIFRGWTMPIGEIDLRVGGKYRFVWRGPDGNEMGLGGVYTEIAKPDRWVNTEKFDEAWYPGEALISSVLVEKGGITTFTATITYESREARDGVLNSPAQEGLHAGFENLDNLLKELQQR